jgi:hypothetical protein
MGRMGDWKLALNQAKQTAAARYCVLPLTMVHYSRGLAISPGLEEVHRMRTLFREVAEILEEVRLAPSRF